MTDPAPTSGFCPIHVENFLALMDCFPPFLRTAATSFWVLALMRCRRFSTDGGLQRGQFYYGRDALSMRLGLSPQTILTIEKRLQKLSEICRESTNEGTTLTLLKFNSYVIDENGINKRSTNDQQTINNKPNVNEKEKEKKEPFVASHDATRCLKAWEQYRPIIEKHRATYLKVFDDLHSYDKVPWEGEDGIFSICAYAVKEWTAKMIQAPSKLRKPSKQYPELKTWQVIQGQIKDKQPGPMLNGKHRPTPAEGGTVRLPYLITNGYDANPIKDPERRLETIKRRYPHLTKDPDQGFAWTLPDEAFK